MKIACAGAGPAALYLAILLKKRNAAHEITLFERHQPGDSFGFGVVELPEGLRVLKNFFSMTKRPLIFFIAIDREGAQDA